MKIMKNLTTELLNGYVNGLGCEAKKAVFETLSLEDIETVFEFGCSAVLAGLHITMKQKNSSMNILMKF